LNLGKVYEGNWYDAGTPGQIKIQNGIMESDWTMRLEGENKARIYAWGIDYIATR
jgi:hypothetical protein